MSEHEQSEHGHDHDFSRFVKDESGATAIEYGLIASLISIAAIAAFTTVAAS